MTPRNLTVRDRLDLVRRPMRAIQAVTYAAGVAFTLIVVFADPGHRLALATIQLFATLIHAILH